MYCPCCFHIPFVNDLELSSHPFERLSLILCPRQARHALDVTRTDPRYLYILARIRRPILCSMYRRLLFAAAMAHRSVRSLEQAARHGAGGARRHDSPTGATIRRHGAFAKNCEAKFPLVVHGVLNTVRVGRDCRTLRQLIETLWRRSLARPAFHAPERTP